MEDFHYASGLLVSRLPKSGWCLVGSYNLYLQGLSVTPRDINISASTKDVRSFGKLFHAEPEEKQGAIGKFLSLEFAIRDVPIEVIGEDEGMYAPLRKNMIWWQCEGYKIPCLPLESELAAYTSLGRFDEAIMLEEYLGRS